MSDRSPLEKTLQPDEVTLGSEGPSGSVLPSPLLIYDWPHLESRLKLFRDLADAVHGHFLYSIKAQPFEALLRRMTPWTDGFSVSSLFEARLARKAGGACKAIHLTSPGIREQDLSDLKGTVTHLHFNSLEQCERLAANTPSGVHLGLRINHGVSSIEDERYNPCRNASKLGVPLNDLKAFAKRSPGAFQSIEGLHFHSHYRERNADSLKRALDRLATELGSLLDQMAWINLGGGYAPETLEEIQGFKAVLQNFRAIFKGKLILEPGAAIVGRAGVLRSRIIDVFEREGQRIGVLDTGVHHLPEVFEYQKAPKIRETDPDGPYPMLLTGSSCLAGDLFGTYRFKTLLQVGDTLTMEEVGAYSLVKASRFNGHDLPGLAVKEASGAIDVLKTFGYEDFLRHWGI